MVNSLGAMRILLWSKFITHGFCFIAFLLPSHISTSRKGRVDRKKRETFRFAFAVLCVVALFPFPCLFLHFSWLDGGVEEAGNRNGISFMRNKCWFGEGYALTILAVVSFSLLTLYYGMAFNFILFTGLLLSLLLCAFYKKWEWKDHLDESGFNVSFSEKIAKYLVSLSRSESNDI